MNTNLKIHVEVLHHAIKITLMQVRSFIHFVMVSFLMKKCHLL
jgi:hypothetical protein